MTNEKELKTCGYFTTDESFCTLICPKIVQGENVKCKKCETCGYNLPVNSNAYCK